MTYRTRCHWWHLSASRWRSCSLSADGSRACRKIDRTRVTLSSLPLFRGETRRLPNSLCHPGHVAPPVTKELRQFDQSARTCLSQAEFPRDLGNSRITTISRVAGQTKAMTPEQLESYVLLENAKLDRSGGETAIRCGHDSRARPENAVVEESLEVERHRRFRVGRRADYCAKRGLARPSEKAVTRPTHRRLRPKRFRWM
jgi:hypothetical protein